MADIILIENRFPVNRLRISHENFIRIYNEKGKRRTQRPLDFLQFFIRMAIEEFDQGRASRRRIEKLCSDLGKMTPMQLFNYVERGGKDVDGYFSPLADL